MTTSTDTFEGWAILELMGHRRLGGYVTEHELAGAKFLRIDVPAEEHGDATCEECGANRVFGCICTPQLGPVAATQFYAPAAVYCITPTTEAMARGLRSRIAPVQRWELPALPAPAQLPTNDEAVDALEEDLDEREYAEVVQAHDDDLPF